MKITSVLITLFSILALTACSQNPPTNLPTVDRPSLIRSMTYTHRHLLEQQLGPRTEEQGSGPILLQSHCDLIRREVVSSELPPKCEPKPGLEQQACVAKFHRCIGQCPTFMKECPLCEQKSEQCLEEVDANSQAGMEKEEQGA